MHLDIVLERWQLSRCDNSAHVQRAVRVGAGWTEVSRQFVAPLNAALLVATRRVPPLSRTVSRCAPVAWARSFIVDRRRSGVLFYAIMKTGIVAVCLLGATLADAWGQCEFGEAVSASNVSVETVGGITYLKFSYPTVCPQHLWKRAAVVQGTNVSQSIFLVSDWLEICTTEFPPTVTGNNATLVLGRLDPGDYLLHLDTAPLFPGGPGSSPLGRVPFTVPAPQPTLSLRAANPGQIVFQVNGTAKATYQVQSSSALTNWATFRTSIGAPFSVTNQPAGSRFYRVQISDGIPLCP